MKFGRNLPRNQVPEWAAFYINYKGLKKLVKGLSETASAGHPVDLAGGILCRTDCLGRARSPT